MRTVGFKTYVADEAKEFADWPEHLVIWARADESGDYLLQIRLKNGLGLISTSKYTLQEAVELLDAFSNELNLSDGEAKIDVTASVLEKPNVVNRYLKKHLQQKGLYWKGKEIVNP